MAMVKALTLKVLPVVVGNKAPLKEPGSRNQRMVVTRKAATLEAMGATRKVPEETNGVGSEGATTNSSNISNNKRHRRNQALVQAASPWGLVAVCLAARYLRTPLTTIGKVIMTTVGDMIMTTVGKMLMPLDMQMGQAETTMEEVTLEETPRS